MKDTTSDINNSICLKCLGNMFKTNESTTGMIRHSEIIFEALNKLINRNSQFKGIRTALCAILLNYSQVIYLKTEASNKE